MHNWGEKDFDWEGLDKAITYIDNRLRQVRVSIRQSKEKHGTCRIYCSLGWYCLHDITHPGHCFYRYPKWLVGLDIDILSKLVSRLFNWWVLPLHRWTYRDAYYKACKKFPHLVEEICCMADFVELLDFYESPWVKYDGKKEVVK